MRIATRNGWLLALALLALLAANRGASADDHPVRGSVDAFFKHPLFDDIKISPDGNYLAGSARITEDSGLLVVLHRDSGRKVGSFRLKGRTLIDDFHWVSARRLVLSVAQAWGSRAAPVSIGELFAVDFDGERPRYLAPFGHNAASDLTFFVDTIPGDENRILVATFRPETGVSRLERLNVRSGRREPIARMPAPRASILSDSQQRARLAWALGDDFRQTVYYRAPDSGDWSVIHDEQSEGRVWTPRFIYPDGESALIEKTGSEGPNGLYRYYFDSGESTLLVRDPTVDPWFVAYATDRSEPVAVAYMDGRPKLTLLDRDSPIVVAWTAVLAANPGEFATPTSATRDGGMVVFRVVSDVRPDRFELYDHATGSVVLLQVSRPWLDHEAHAIVEPIRVTARDGLPLHGYLARPVDREGVKLPLIVNPHGGPIGVRDEWGFDPEVQFFASRGFATLRVNFRGSGSYGDAFLRAGFRQWGTGMIDDITDAVRWAIAERDIDPDRICIYGASYGGYAAMKSTIRAPGLYRCAVGYVGVYDLPLMFENDEISDQRWMRQFFSESLGADAASVEAISPVHHADRIRVPVMLAAGKRDSRVSVEHSERMRDALTAAGNPPEWLVEEYEGHGFFKLENNRELYTRMASFFERHLGDGAIAAEARQARLDETPDVRRETGSRPRAMTPEARGTHRRLSRGSGRAPRAPRSVN